MSSFADRMQTFCGHLTNSIREREEALEQIGQATNDLLNEARSFLNDVTEDRQAAAAELRSRMKEFQDAHRERVAEMRRNHHERLEEMRSDMNTMLEETRAARHESVNSMMTEFGASRRELSDDLREASRAWREFATQR